MTDGLKVLLSGVIGHPIAHSKSPSLHNYWLKKYGISGYYMPLDIVPENLFAAIEIMPKMGFVGANVTIPHKEDILKISDKISTRALEIGAANTLCFGANGSVEADNSDAYGFIKNIYQSYPDWDSKKTAAVIGAGGAARAVVWALLNEGAPEVRITNRTKHRAESIANDFGSKVKVVSWKEAPEMLDGAMSVVNTTSLGMIGKAPFDISLANLNSAAMATDLVYNPLKTTFLEQAEQKGCHVVDGLGMLLHQAAIGFEKWFGKWPEVDTQTRQVVL